MDADIPGTIGQEVVVRLKRPRDRLDRGEPIEGNEQRPIAVPCRLEGLGPHVMLLVTEDQFRRIAGEESWADERAYRAEVHALGLELDPPWRLFPYQILRALGIREGEEVTLVIGLLRHPEPSA